jgi:hypothetical protein
MPRSAGWLYVRRYMSGAMDTKKIDEAIHRAELKRYLSKDELTLPDEEREVLLLERKLVDSGALREEDLFINKNALRDSVKKTVPKDLQVVGVVAAVLLTAIFVEQGGSIDGAFLLLVKSIPACAIGLFIYKKMVKHEFRKPASWPEWIFLYIIGMLIGGPLLALVSLMFEKLFS